MHVNIAIRFICSKLKTEIMEVFENYPNQITQADIDQFLIKSKSQSRKLFTVDNLKLVFSLLDLHVQDQINGEEKAKSLAEKINRLQASYAGIPHLAAVCVYPNLIKTVATYLKIKTVGLVSFSGGFPSSQTFLDIKTSECKEAVLAGATDIDVMLPIVPWLAGNYDKVLEEIKAMKEAVGYSHTKVIIETSLLKKHSEIWNASILAMEAGAEFICNSSGHNGNSSSSESVYIMCEAIKAYHAKTGRKVGLKIVDGMVNSEDALLYVAIVKMVLGDDWMNKKHCRLGGASRVANNLVQDIVKLETGKDEPVTYF